MTRILCLLFATWSVSAFAVQTKECPAAISIEAEGPEIFWGLIQRYRRERDKDIEIISAIANEAAQREKSWMADLKLEKYRTAGRCEYVSRNRKITADITGTGQGLFRLNLNLDKTDGSVTIYANIEKLSPESLQLMKRSSLSLYAYFDGASGPYYDGGPERRRIGLMTNLKINVK